MLKDLCKTTLFCMGEATKVNSRTNSALAPMFNLGWLEFHSNVTVITLYPSHYFSQFTPFDYELDIL